MSLLTGAAVLAAGPAVLATGPLGTPPGDVPSNPANVELTFTLACAAVVGLGLVAMLVHRRRGGTSVGLLVLIGAMASTIQEPMVDTLGNMYIPPSHYTVFTTYGREMPAFAPFGYGLYFGIPMFLYLRAATRGAGVGEFQKLFVGSIGLELVFELIAVNGGFYTYYGDQPFRFFELPLHWMTLNMAAAWVAAAAVHRALPYLAGWRVIAVPPLVVCTITCSYYAQGWPIFSAMHTEDAPPLLLALASLATVGLGVAIIQAMIRILAAPTAADRLPATARTSARQSATAH